MGVAPLTAPNHWQVVDVISDTHLQVSEPATAAAWTRYLDQFQGDALFILGDLFELWVGDDTLAQAEGGGAFLSAICDTLARCAQRCPVYVMHGNRDFLLGLGFHQRTNTQALADPTLLQWGAHRWLLTHGDAWCLGDHSYMAFRQQVRTAAWQQAFLARPLTDRLAWAQGARAHSEANKRRADQVYADVDTPTALAHMGAHGATVLVHGHTHQPGQHTLAPGLHRLVLPDWDAAALPPRGGGLRLYRDGRWETTPAPA
jgi:UDP-2,3-diacylglucosamine hydrolase